MPARVFLDDVDLFAVGAAEGEQPGACLSPAEPL
jgi:hypothetical protein